MLLTFENSYFCPPLSVIEVPYQFSKIPYQNIFLKLRFSA